MNHRLNVEKRGAGQKNPSKRPDPILNAIGLLSDGGLSKDIDGELYAGENALLDAEELVFGYGSNMDLEQMRSRCPSSSLRPSIAEARGWRLCFPRLSRKRRGGVGSIARSAGDSVWGVVFLVSSHDLAALDRHEGVTTWPPRYHRERIELHDPAGAPVAAWTYFAVPQAAGHYLPSKGYIDLYLRGARQFGLPVEYIERLQKIETNGLNLDG